MTRYLLPCLCAAAISLASCGKPQSPTNDDAAMPGAPALSATPTVAMGQTIFRRCMACHTITRDGPNGVGPNLHGVVGRAVASHPGFAYSPVMKAKGGIWDKASLDAFLKQPMKVVPGTRMAFAGIADDTDRAALILFLADQS